MPGMLTHWRRRVGAFIGGFEAGLAGQARERAPGLRFGGPTMSVGEQPTEDGVSDQAALG